MRFGKAIPADYRQTSFTKPVMPMEMVIIFRIPSKVKGDSVMLSSAFPSTSAQGKFC